MPRFRTIARIKADRVRSLVWHGDQLIDWVGGGARYELDGTTIPCPVSYPFRFDAACCSNSGEYAIVYERLGTKAALLREGRVIREFNRSYYHASAYEYPICFAQLRDESNVVIHCPDKYNKIEIEVVESGERITRAQDREPSDFFHSRLSVDTSNRYLLSAGWVWQPFDAICLWNLQEAIEQPQLLDETQVFLSPSTEICSAAFTDSGKVILGTSAESFADDDEFEDGDLRPVSIAIWDIESQSLVHQTRLDSALGNLMPIGETHVIDFYEHPKIISIETGKVLERLDEIDSGVQRGSIIHNLAPVPPTATDTTSNRFAVANGSEIVVVEVTL